MGRSEQNMELKWNWEFEGARPSLQTNRRTCRFYFIAHINRSGNEQNSNTFPSNYHIITREKNETRFQDLV
jgi:hypothetical protein